MKGTIIIIMSVAILVMAWLFFDGYNKAEISLSKPATASEKINPKSDYNVIDSFIKDRVGGEREVTVYCRINISGEYECTTLLEYHLNDLKVSYQKRRKSIAEALNVAKKHISDNF